MTGPGAFCGASSVASAKAVGLEVLSEDYFSLDTTDFSSLVLKLQRLKPDVLDISGVYDSFTAAFMKSAQELGVPWKMGVIGGGYFSGTEMVRAGAPDQMVEGMLTLGYDYHSDIWTAEIREAAKKYEETYGFIQPWVIHSMSAVYVMKSVMERSGSVDRDKMYEYMSAPNATFDSLFGEIGLWGEDSWFFGIDRVLQVTPGSLDLQRRQRCERRYHAMGRVWRNLALDRACGLPGDRRVEPKSGGGELVDDSI